MPAVNEIFAPLGNRMETTTATVYQYNSGMMLRVTGPELPDNYRVDFANSVSGQSKSMLGGADGVLIPYEYFLPGSYIHAWIVLTGEDYAVTRYHITIPISPRAVPTEEQPSPEQESIIGQAITALNESVVATGQDVISANEAKEAAQTAAILAGQIADDMATVRRIASLDDTPIAGGQVLEIIGIPAYVSDVSEYADYGLTEKGWYAFARVTAKGETTVSQETTVAGAAGYAAQIGEKYVDVAVRFDTTAQSQTVTIYWGPYTDSFVFKASDLAVRNLDYRVTFYVYDITPYVAWTYALTADTTFAANKKYYTKDGDVYTLASVAAGEAVPADTYYNHSKVHFEGMASNVTYRLDEMVDCPIEIVLPEIADDGHGAWFEIQMRYNGSYSCTLLPPTGVKIGTATTQAQSAGMNTIDLQYTNVDGVKMWTLLNTHSNIPA